VLGGIAILAGLARSVTAGDRTWDAIRIALIAVALGLVTYERHVVVPEMEAMTDVSSPAYHALHARSSSVYGGVVLLDLIALVLAASRRED
jgi:hypothetical protein